MIVVEGLVVCTTVLACTYILASLYIFVQLKKLHQSSNRLNTRKLFTMSCLLACILRVMSFGSITGLNYYRYGDSLFNSELDDDQSLNFHDMNATEKFYAKSLFVLFDLPDFCVMSAYFLLLIVWGESYLESRRHWLSSKSYRKSFMLGYLIFNVGIYSAQVTLYMLLFIPGVDQELLLEIIYALVATLNFTLPVLWVLVFIVLGVQFAGFPFVSRSVKRRLNNLHFLVGIWTICKILWGLFTLTTALDAWLAHWEKYRLRAFFFVLLVFLCTDLFPILYSMRSEVLGCLANDPISIDENLPRHRQTLGGFSEFGDVDREHLDSITNPLLNSQANDDGEHTLVFVDDVEQYRRSDRSVDSDMEFDTLVITDPVAAARYARLHL